MFIGRWQTWHAGHEWLIRQQLDKGKDVWVAIRDVPEDESNPKSAYKVMMDLMEEPFFQENIDKIFEDNISFLIRYDFHNKIWANSIYGTVLTTKTVLDELAKLRFHLQ